MRERGQGDVIFDPTGSSDVDRRGRFGAGLLREADVMRIADLAGSWRLSREIKDLRAGLPGQLDGSCTWTPDAEGYVQEESGLLHYGSAPPLQATRRYLWREIGEELHVFFEDGRPFHVVPPVGQEAVHHCDPDMYRVTYLFDLPYSFCTTWHVSGPRKDARIETRFLRV